MVQKCPFCRPSLCLQDSKIYGETLETAQTQMVRKVVPFKGTLMFSSLRGWSKLFIVPPFIVDLNSELLEKNKKIKK